MISEELLQSFIAEASDLLDDVEPSLVEYSRLQDVEERTEIVNRVFRHFHSIKGSAGFVGLHAIARLTHEAETLLEQFRRSPEKIISQDNIALLCRTVDLLRAIFENGGEDEDDDDDELGIGALITEISVATTTIKGKPAVGFSALNISAEPRDLPLLENENPDATQVVDPQDFKAAVPPAPAAEPPPKTAMGATTKVRQRAATRSGSDTPKKPTAISRTRRLTSDTARIIHADKMASEDKKMNAAEFASRYVSEANELLEQIEQALLHAEQHPETATDSVHEALRCLHSFKGNSGFMNLTDLERLSHRMESEIEVNIGRSLGLDSQTFDVLLQMIDVLRQGVLDFSCGGSGSIPEADAYITMMDEFSRANTETNVGAGRGAHPTEPAPAHRQAPTATIPPQPAKPIALPPAEAPEAGAGAGGADSAPTRTLKPHVPAPRSNTTRLVLRGTTSPQEDLRAAPRADSIQIIPETEVRPAPPPSAGALRGGTVPGVKKKETEAARTKPANSDTGQKRRTAEQLAARNDIRVDLRKLDAMLDLVGELVIAEAMVTRHPIVWNADSESLERAVHQLRRVAGSLQDMATSVRMIPLAPTFRRMTRLVYDLSVKAGKQVDLVLLGEDTEVDRTVIERISDPLVHIIRNAIDHGIEPPEERLALDKPETGRLTIEGHHEGGEVWIVITDDGRGLDRDAILKRAISRGLVQGDGSDLTDNQIYHFIFEPGFSTANKVTDISGRGFGMDVVKKNIEKLSGKIDIRTRPGEGMAVVLRIPLTLAIIEGMLVRSGTTRYIIPLLSIRESLRPDPAQIFATPDGQEVVKLRDELIPIVRLDETFNRMENARSLEEGILMIVEGEDGEVVALFADELLGQQETVIKGLSGWLKKSRGVSGCTILGDGEVGLILDIGAIVRLARQRSSA
ncbi:MAG: chemotaxis protein CheA [Planctomycetes bacterium]|nr:chemotaxis protein CheA [Planctomycetota bacterium]